MHTVGLFLALMVSIWVASLLVVNTTPVVVGLSNGRTEGHPITELSEQLQGITHAPARPRDVGTLQCIAVLMALLSTLRTSRTSQ